MNPRPRLSAVIVMCGCALPGWSAEQPKVTDDDLRIRGVFESALPGTEQRKSLRLIVHPHLGDVREREHLRTALGFRYGLTSRWEATAESDFYFSHGAKSMTFLRERGFSSLHLGSKYRLGEVWASGWECSVGADFVQPIGAPPSSMTDGLRHVAPYVTFARRLKRWPDWRVFCGTAYDFVGTTGIAGKLSKNQLTDDSVGVSAGLLWTRGSVTYTLEGSYATMHPTSDSTRDILTLRPGFVWAIPPIFKFGTSGKWLLGFALRMSDGVEGFDLGASAKLRVNFDFKRLLGLKPKETATGR